MEGSYWFRRFVKEVEKLSAHIKVVRIKYGFYRIYYKQAYLGEAYKEMPQFGHDIYEKNIHFENKKYVEALEDKAEYVRKVKNFVEGYWENIDKIRTRFYMMKHDEEFYNNAIGGYKQVVIK